MERLKISDWLFAVLALAIAIGGIFASEYHYGDYQIGALAAALGIVMLWILFDAAHRRGWDEKILNIFSDRCDCGSREYKPVGITSLNSVFFWVHFFCPDCKRFFRRLRPMSSQYFSKDI